MYGRVVTTLPYMTNPSDMISHTVDLVKEGKIAGITDVQNLTNKRNGTCSPLSASTTWLLLTVVP